MPLLKRRRNKRAKAAQEQPEASQQATKKKAQGGDFAAQEAALKPTENAAGPAALPGSTQELKSDPRFIISPGGSFVGSTIPKNVEGLVMRTIIAEGISDAKTLSEALQSYIDQATVWVADVARQGGTNLTWVTFYAGDTEVGGLFEGGALVALVSDGAIMPA